MKDMIEEIEVELSEQASAVVGTCIEINEASNEIAENTCDECLEHSRGIFEAVRETLVAIIYAVLNAKEASVLVRVGTNDDGVPVITVHPDDEIRH